MYVRSFRFQRPQPHFRIRTWEKIQLIQMLNMEKSDLKVFIWLLVYFLKVVVVLLPGLAKSAFLFDDFVVPAVIVSWYL
jgi:hypothetical protein